MNTKVVNIYPTSPITRINPPIRSVVRNVTKSYSEIRICLMNRATVEEVLPNGTTVRLGLHNYNKVNYEVEGIVEPIITTPAVEPEVAEPEKTDKVVDDEPSADATNSAWDVAYENALAGKDLASMTKKQRKDAKAEARAIADAAVAAAETTEAPVEDNEVVETADVEDLSNVTE